MARARLNNGHDRLQAAAHPWERMPLILTSEVERTLTAAARAARPAEFVAVLGCRGSAPDVVTTWVPVQNRAAGRDRFVVHPADFAAAEARLRRTRHSFLGFAHSHPDGTSTPSATDRAELWTGCMHVIVAVAPDGECTLGAHRLDDSRRAHEVPILRAAPAPEHAR